MDGFTGKGGVILMVCSTGRKWLGMERCKMDVICSSGEQLRSCWGGDE